jgi:drug/metabolite transporter (DMT)-like permease
MHALVRHVSAGVHPFEVAFFRSLFGLLAVAPLVLRAGPAVLLSHRPKLVILRGVCSAVSLLCWFHGLSVVPIATATALSFTNVIFGSVGVALILGEPMRGRRWLAVGLGFLGMLLIVRPGVGAVDRGTLIVLLSAVLWGASTVIVKEISRTDGTLTIVVWAAITLTVATAVPALMVWRWPSASELLWLALIGTLASLGTLAWTYALKTAEATLIIPLDFLRLVWAGAIGFFVFVELPGAWTWAGSALIVASTVYIAMPEARAPARA